MQDSGTGRAEGPHRATFWRWLPLAAVAVLLAGAYAAGLADYLALDRIAAYRDTLSDAVARQPAVAAALYVVVYAAAVGVSFPGASVLTIAGGFMFGCVLGTVFAAAAATVGATLIFLVASTSMGDFLARRAGSRLQKLRTGFAEEAFNYVLVLRLAPVFPFWMVNLAAALSGMKVAPYVLATAIGILPGTFAFSYLGQNLDAALLGETPTGLVLALGLLAVMALIPVLLRLRRRARADAVGTSRGT